MNIQDRCRPTVSVGANNAYTASSGVFSEGPQRYSTGGPRRKRTLIAVHRFRALGLLPKALPKSTGFPGFPEACNPNANLGRSESAQSSLDDEGVDSAVFLLTIFGTVATLDRRGCGMMRG